MSEVQTQLPMVESAYEEFLRAVVGYAQEAKTFAEAQIPDVIAQLLTWKLVEHGVYTIIGIISLVLSLMLAIFIKNQFKITPEDDAQYCKFKYGRSTKESWDFLMFGSCFAGIALTIAGTVMVITNIMKVLYIWVAPKAYLIEYGANLIK